LRKRLCNPGGFDDRLFFYFSRSFHGIEAHRNNFMVVVADTGSYMDLGVSRCYFIYFECSTDEKKSQRLQEWLMHISIKKILLRRHPAGDGAACPGGLS
jgi:hypothetical protein